MQRYLYSLCAIGFYLISFTAHGQHENKVHLKNPISMNDTSKQKNPLKKELVNVNFTEPLFINQNGGKGETLLWYSVLTDFSPELYATYNMHANDTHGYNIYASNSTIIGMYRFAYSDWFSYYGLWCPIPSSRVRVQLKDTFRLKIKTASGSSENAAYTYQLISREPVAEQKLKDVMQTDLAKYFGLKVRWVKEKTKCLVLTASDTGLLAYKGGAYWTEARKNHLKMNKVTLKEMIDYLALGTGYAYSPYPLLDETGYKGLLGIEVKTNVLNYKDLDKALKKYKLRISLQEREVPILYITD
jgi:hypothetical protein